MNYDQGLALNTLHTLVAIREQLETNNFYLKELLDMAKSTKCTPVNPDNAMQSNGNKVFQGGGGTAGVGKGAVRPPKAPKGK